MIYLICFIVSLATVLFIIHNGKGVDVNIFILNIIIAVGNGGYYALSEAKNLSEAILANKITYVIGCFAPMIMFLIIFKLCSINIKSFVQIIFYLIQMLVFLSVCTIGKSDIYYKTVDFVIEKDHSYLVKTYGPMHTVYIALMCTYMIGTIAIVGYSISRKQCRISSVKANLLLLLFLSSEIIYFAERFAHITIELMPVIFTVTNFFVSAVFIQISRYSVYENLAILENKKKEIAYMVFNKKLMYMSCNDYALQLFPELSDWEIEKEIPGSGGRFNTFLRVPFMNYVNGGLGDEGIISFEFKNELYRVVINRLYDGKSNHNGYIIEVAKQGRENEE